MKKSAKCKCGKLLTGRQKVQCSDCYIKSHPASSQCAYCFQWYWSHGGQSYLREIKLHAAGGCRKREAA